MKLLGQNVLNKMTNLFQKQIMSKHNVKINNFTLTWNRTDHDKQIHITKYSSKGLDQPK